METVVTTGTKAARGVIVCLPGRAGPGKGQVQKDAATSREAGREQGSDSSSPDLPGLRSFVVPPTGRIQLKIRLQASEGNACKAERGQSMNERPQGEQLSFPSRAFPGMSLRLRVFGAPLTCGLLLGENV